MRDISVFSCDPKSLRPTRRPCSRVNRFKLNFAKEFGFSLKVPYFCPDFVANSSLGRFIRKYERRAWRNDFALRLVLLSLCELLGQQGFGLSKISCFFFQFGKPRTQSSTSFRHPLSRLVAYPLARCSPTIARPPSTNTRSSLTWRSTCRRITPSSSISAINSRRGNTFVLRFRSVLYATRAHEHVRINYYVL